MQFTLESNDQSKLVSHYGPGFFDINERRYETSLCLHAAAVIAPWEHGEAKSLTIESFSRILESSPEILILGTGENMIFPTPALMAGLQLHGTVLETMSSSAACRTYNVLASERRRVAAALMLIQKN